MDSIQINGGIPLQGQVRIQGSKNAVLPILAATVLIEGTCLLSNCPKILDVYRMQKMLTELGSQVYWKGNELYINSENINSDVMKREDTKSIRSSITLLGALIGRTKEAKVGYPGGCVIGNRPIDIHIEALSSLGVSFVETEEYLLARADHLHEGIVKLRFPSVGATENLILSSVLVKGNTVIQNAAKEPEIYSLCEFLNTAGAKIEGAGTSVISIKGVERLNGCSYSIPGDRIVAGTYLAGCMVAGGAVLLREAPVNQMKATLNVAEHMGALLQRAPEGLYVEAPRKLVSPCNIKTGVYPGFPTDLQSAFLVLLTQIEGESQMEETIFENRFRIVDSLRAMGADLTVNNCKVIVKGKTPLYGTVVNAEELRGGAALVMAGLGAKGNTKVDSVDYIYRGYENIGRDLRELGARVYSV